MTPQQSPLAKKRRLEAICRGIGQLDRAECQCVADQLAIQMLSLRSELEKVQARLETLAR